MKHEGKILLVIALLALLLRVGISLFHPFNFPDSHDYDQLARAIVAGQTYAVDGHLATRMPGYPLFLAAVYQIFNGSAKAALIVQALAGTLTVCVVYKIGRRFSAEVALGAAFLAAIDPLSLGFTATLLSEMLFTLSLLVALWLCLELMERANFFKWVLLGWTWCLAVYLRPSALWCLVVLAAVICVGQRRSERLGAMGGAIVAVALVLASLLPWQARNFGIFHSGFFRLTTLEGISLYEAVYPGADGGPQQDKIALPPEMIPLNEVERNDEWGRRAWHEIAVDPLRILKLAIVKIGRTWAFSLNAAGFQGGTLRFALIAWHLPLFVLALVGAVRFRMPIMTKALLLAPILYFTAVHALFLGSVRYRVPLMPLVCLFAAMGFCAIMESVKSRQRRRQAVV